MIKTLATITLLILAAASLALGQNQDEQEILKMHAAFDEAYLKKDISLFERTLADDYVYSDPYGKMYDRTQNLAEMRKEWASPKYKVVTAASDATKARVIGNAAVVTSNWTYATVPTNAPANAVPHKDVGRYTGVYEKRGGKWMLIAEHFSEAPHDRKLMEEQILKAGQEYGAAIKVQDAAAMERMLADEYSYTNEKGEVKNKVEDLANVKAGMVKFETFDVLDQKVRVIGNGAAVETGTVKFKGALKDGKTFEGSERFTTTWVWRDGRWQVVADHTSSIPK